MVIIDLLVSSSVLQRRPLTRARVVVPISIGRRYFSFACITAVSTVSCSSLLVVSMVNSRQAFRSQLVRVERKTPRTQQH